MHERVRADVIVLQLRFDFELNLLNNPQLHISAIVSVLGNVGKLC